MNWDYESSSLQTRRHHPLKDTRTHSQRRKDIRFSVHVERNFPHGQGWLSSVVINKSETPSASPLIRLGFGGYRLGHPLGFKRYRKVVHISVLDLTLTINWRQNR